MRIPFIPKVTDPHTLIRPELEKFIKETRGGSAFLLSGALFWLVGAAVSYWWPEIKVPYIIYGGIFVPVAAIIIGKLIHAAWLIKSPYAVLAAIAPFIELAAIPIMIFLRPSFPDALPGVLMICEGVHYLIYMWLHLDYYFFILAYVKVFLGIMFMFGIWFPGNYTMQLLISGVISAVAALLVGRDSQRVMQLYTKKS